MFRTALFRFSAVVFLSFFLVFLSWNFLMRDHPDSNTKKEYGLMPEVPAPVVLDEFNLPADSFFVEKGTVRPRQTLSHIFSDYAFTPVETERIARRMEPVFNPRNIRSGNSYYGYFTQQGSGRPMCFVYEINDLDFLVVDLRDSVNVYRDRKHVEYREKAAAATIRHSLWNTLVDHDLPPELAVHMSRILAWTVDFHRIRHGDGFSVLYTEQYVGERPVGISHVDAVYFVHHGHPVEGYRFETDTLKGYYDREGNNLRKVFLRAPVEFVRISSRYSHSRLHPVHGDRRPHLGTDYAAPHGTPILAVGDGVVTRAAYTRGNGNYVRIRHNSVYETQYLHMSRFASGIRPGARVSQGDVIGYVGSTGVATGPHVCFRFWKNGQQVDHLRIEFPSGDPLPDVYLDSFRAKADSLQARLRPIG